jgi:hypothetical protein
MKTILGAAFGAGISGRFRIVSTPGRRLSRRPSCVSLPAEGLRPRGSLLFDMRPLDTSEDALRFMDEKFRQMTPAQKIQRVASLTTLTQGLALAQIRTQYPEENERRWRVRLLARTVDRAAIPESVRAALGWPDDDR